MNPQLKKIRSDTARVKKQIRQTHDAIRPFESLENDLRAILNSMAAPRRSLVETCAAVLAHGAPLSELVAHGTDAWAKRSYGLGLSAIGVDAIVDEAVAKARAGDTGALRLGDDEKADRLDELRRELYTLELAEERALDGEPRRPDVNAAAVLQIPLEVAIEAGLLAKKGE